MNLYETLQINENASIEEIKKSYRILARKYHPDKNKDENASKKFIEINTAYEILINDESRIKYIKLTNEKKNTFGNFLKKIFEIIDYNSSNRDDTNDWLKNNFNIITGMLNTTVSKKNIEILHNKLIPVLNNLNFNEVFDFFISGEIPNKKFDINEKKAELSESDLESWNEDMALYFNSLPLEIQNISLKKDKSSKTLWISHQINIDQIIKDKSIEIIIKRYFNKKICANNNSKLYENTRFRFNTKNKWVVFFGGGDQKDDGTFGDLIVRLNLPQNYEWEDDIILIKKEINIYQFIYGLDIDIINEEINKNDKNLLYIKNKYEKINGTSKINSWVPVREGNIIFLFEEQSLKFGIKLVLNIPDSSEKKETLKKLFDSTIGSM